MKLEKREITLNEIDSLKDVAYWEHFLLGEYEKEKRKCSRKEVDNLFMQHMQEIKEEADDVRHCLKKLSNER